MSLYWIVNLLAISVPFFVSFHPRIQLHKRWSLLFLAITISLTPFVIWDVWFTQVGYWGFNENYLTGHYFLDLPLEEWFFFIAIPYACIFTHYSLTTLWPKIKVSNQLVNIITGVLLVLMLVFAIVYHEKMYTYVDMVFGIIILVFAYVIDPSLLRKFYLTFLVMLIPFFMVNGILTGTGIEGEIVWYNNAENLGLRIGTIPIEDVLYAFSLILLNLVLFRLLGAEKKD
jgi:lycopene cyclase domain-containing protein